MAYTTKELVTTYISGPALITFLDDDSDGSEDTGLFDAIVAACSLDADGFVASTYRVPFGNPAPAAIRAATTIFTCEALYARRLTPDELNPFKARGDMWRKILRKIGEDGTGLDAATDRDFAPGTVVTIPAIFHKSMQ